MDGGYDDGYEAVPCLWGRCPGSLIKWYLALNPFGAGASVLDLGCGEGKNAAAFAEAGYTVAAIDCSRLALERGRAAFGAVSIKWHEADARGFDCGEASYDVIVMYGLLHCLSTKADISAIIARAKRATKAGGHHLLCAFNNRSQDLRAHPKLNPTLLPHEWYISGYSDWEVLTESDRDLYETHPHNRILHHHSLTRLVVRKPP